MAEKKRIAETKIVEKRMSKPQGTRSTVKPSDPIRSTTSRSGGAAAEAAAKPSGAQTQLSNFEAAMKQFHTRNFREARTLFEKAAAGPERDVANRASLHKSMCDRRLEQAKPVMGNAEDFYNYGVAMINTRNIPEARSHLEQALKMSPGADHIHYALALAQALDGDLANAHENLRRAIELEPRNRTMARQDADFAPLANQPPFDALIYPEKKEW
jgi:tetratricopeptide (TPR) repeat protein